MAKKNILFFSALLLIANLIFRLINQSKMMFIFPLEGTDWHTHIFELWALAKYGFHGLVTNWYNGYSLFQFYTPGWYFFALPFLWLTNNVLYATYLSVIAALGLTAIGLYYLCKTEKISKQNFVVFFALFIANALSISNFIRNGRVTELFGWCIFTFLILMVFYYKKNPIDIKFILFVPLFALLILSHFVVPILFALILLGLLIIKPNKEKIYIILSALTSLLLSSFWWFPLITNLNQSYITGLKYSSRLLALSDPVNFVLSIIIPLIFIGMFVFYYKTNKSKENLLFFFPAIIFSILFASKVTAFIPILNRIYPHPAILFFLFFTIYFVFKLQPDTKLVKIITALLMFAILLSLAVNIIHTPLVHNNGSIENKVIDILPKITERYIILGVTPDHFFNFAIYSYGAIYHNLNSSWGGWQTTAYSNEYHAKITQTWSAFTDKNCKKLTEKLLEVNTTEILSFQKDCRTLYSCGYEKITDGEDICLYKINQK